MNIFFVLLILQVDLAVDKLLTDKNFLCEWKLKVTMLMNRSFTLPSIVGSQCFYHVTRLFVLFCKCILRPIKTDVAHLKSRLSGVTVLIQCGSTKTYQNMTRR